MAVDVILGLQWGDEGKGKIVDYLAENYDIVCRFQGGPNAGHTLKIGGRKYVLHTIPSGIFRENIINIIGNGVVLDPITMAREMDNLDKENFEYKSRLLVSQKAHLIVPTHRYLDAASEASKGSAKIGSTLKGIGPAYMDKTGRNGLRAGDILASDFESRYNAIKEKHLGLLKLYPEVDFDLEAQEHAFFESIEILRSLQLVNSEYYVNNALSNGKNILAEGAQGSMLDIDFGTYPFVTSSSTISAGVCSGLGIAPNKIREVIGIAKAYCTRVGSGPFPTELNDEMGEKLRKEGMEFGATTGRPRRCGWIDIPQLKYTIMINGVTQIIITKLDVLDAFDQISAAVSYLYDGITSEALPFDIVNKKIDPVYRHFDGWNTSLSSATTFSQLPDKAKSYIAQLEQLLETQISMVSTGPEREKLLSKK
ncbi:MAG: adenylosuccinate synthase [Saprospiraceae bacterium]|nr:MAG: adenylosuccinate synthetase [Bacteroidetes bacterium OLB9]MCO6464337.1 adenylosuccinate synthase [Saprospiraceae bacterium]MCZ2336806.1 adenylosuccinate synthase [Chitinophagales bacterium]